MRTKSFFLFALATSAMILNLSGCKDDDKPSTIPTQPTTMSIENGAEISETKVSLSVSGSTVEDQECNISYDYYIGTSQDNLVKTSPQDINLTPYTQYFWYAKAKTETDESEPTEIRTFYCVPPFEIETDNGDGEWTAVLRFKGLPAHKGGKVTLTPDKQGYNYQKEIEIPEGQDFCSIKMGNANNPTNAAYTHWWDDEHGIYYEPIIYDFKAVVNVQVGDKTISISNNAKEIILDKQSCVRDYEFNVYRLVKIGNQIWTADNFVSKTININNSTYKIADIFSKYFSNGESFDMPNDAEAIAYKTVKLPSGDKTTLYNLTFFGFIKSEFASITEGRKLYGTESFLDLLKRYLIPKGFHISTIDDWYELEKYYGVDVDINAKNIKTSEHKDEGESAAIRSKLASPYGWCDEEGNSINLIGGPLNVKPFGVNVTPSGMIEINGLSTVVFADAGGESELTDGQAFRIDSSREAIKRMGSDYIHYVCIRLVKDK